MKQPRSTPWVGLLSFLLLTVSAACTLAQPAPEGQDVDTTQTAFVNELEMEVRLQVGAFRWSHSAPPLIHESIRFLKRPVSGNLSFTTALFGIGGALRYKGLEVRMATHNNSGLSPTSYLYWQTGQRALPLRPEFQTWAVKGRYWLTDWYGFGAGYTSHLTTFWPKIPAQINGIQTDRELFSSTVTWNSITFFIPLRYNLHPLSVSAAAGVSIYGSSRQHYEIGFAGDGESAITRTQQEVDGQDIEYESETHLRRQFIQIGLAYPVLGSIIRLTGSATRVNVPSVRANWLRTVRLEVGRVF